MAPAKRHGVCETIALLVHTPAVRVWLVGHERSAALGPPAAMEEMEVVRHAPGAKEARGLWAPYAVGSFRTPPLSFPNRIHEYAIREKSFDSPVGDGLVTRVQVRLVASY